MDNFENVQGLNPEQQLRAWAVEKSSEILTTGLISPRRNSVVSLADKIETYVKTGESTSHDDETMTKVHKALHESDFAFTEGDVTSIVSCLQNAGILFRERA